MGSGLAHAGKRVVVLDVTGPHARAARTVTTRLLRSDHQVVPRRQVRSEARKLGVSTRCNPMMIPGLASVLGAEGVVCGKLRRGKLELKVYNGGDGQIVRTIRVAVASPGGRERAVRHLEAALSKTWNWAAVEVNSSTPQRPTRTAAAPAQADRTVTATMPEPHAWDASDTENPLAETTRAPRSEAPRAPAVVRARPAARPRADGEHAVKLSLGPAFLLRRNYGVYDAATVRDAQGWKTTPVAGLTVATELYPAAWFTRGWAANVGLGLAYSRYFGLSWRTAGDQEDHIATHQVFSADLRGRYRYSFGPRSVVAGIHAGYRRLSFMMNDSATRAVVPDVAFSSLDLGLEAEATVLPRWLSASARFSLLPVLGRGEIVTAEEYGSGSGLGLALGAGVSGTIKGPFGWKLDVDYTRYTVVFDGDPSSARHASKARDRYLSAALAVTYRN